MLIRNISEKKPCIKSNEDEIQECTIVTKSFRTTEFQDCYIRIITQNLKKITISSQNDTNRSSRVLLWRGLTVHELSQINRRGRLVFKWHYASYI